MAQIYQLDSNGIPFEFPVYYLDSKEYGKIISGYNDYNIYAKHFIY